MYIFSELGLYVLYLLIFSVVYFSYEKISSWNAMIKITKYKLLNNFIEGTLLGSITIIMILINNTIDSKSVMPLFVSSAILLLIYKNYQQSLYSIAPGFLYYVFNSAIENEVFLVIGTLMFSLMAIIIIKNFANNFYTSFLYYLLFSALFLFATLYPMFGFMSSDIESIYRHASIIYVFTIFAYFIMGFIIRFSKSSKILSESARFSFLNYLRYAMAIPIINDFIYKKKIKYGALIVFDIKILNETFDIPKDAMKMHVLEEISNRSKEFDATLFNISEELNAIFLPANKIDLNNRHRVNRSMSIAIDSILSSRGINIIYDELKPPISFNVNAGVSIYGLDNSSLGELIDYSTFALTRSLDEQITDFKSNEYIKAINENYDFIEMDKAIKLDEYQNYYTPLLDIKTGQNFVTWAHVENISEFQFFENTQKAVFSKNWETTFDRFFTATALTAAKGNPIASFYSPTIFERDFDVRKFLSFFKRNKIDHTSVYLIFSSLGLQKIENIKKVEEVINTLRNEGINFIYPHSYLETNKNIKYFYIYEKDLEKLDVWPSDKILILPDATNRTIIKNALGKGISIVGGKTFSDEMVFKIFDKKSKIDLKGIVGGKND